MSAHTGAAFRHNRTKKVCASAPTDGLVPTAAAVRKLPTMQVVVNLNARWLADRPNAKLVTSRETCSHPGACGFLVKPGARYLPPAIS
jgi:hypothetical protein